MLRRILLSMKIDGTQKRERYIQYDLGSNIAKKLCEPSLKGFHPIEIKLNMLHSITSLNCI